MNLLHVSHSDIHGGAGRAAYRIHRCLVDHGDAHGLQSQMRVVIKHGTDPTVLAGSTPAQRSRLLFRLHPILRRLARRQFTTDNPTMHSIAWPATGLGSEISLLHTQGVTDLVHLHWLGDSTLSIEEIGRLPMPVVWTLHDQWAFCGAEHYTRPPALGDTESTDRRFELGYTVESRSAHEVGPDLNRLTWLRKQRAWRRPIHVICTTSWLGDCARQSYLMRDWPITVIPYPINLDAWTPVDQTLARNLLGLPCDRPLVLFGAVGGTADSRKGADLLLQALKIMSTNTDDMISPVPELVVFGQSAPPQADPLGFTVHFAGRIGDDLRLRLLYAAADVMVVPSRQEAFGQTASEAHACGTPVVAFRTGGLKDIVDDRVTGALAEPFDPASLAEAIAWVLVDPHRRRQLGAAARQRAERLWNPARIAGMYADVYRQAMEAQRPASRL